MHIFCITAHNKIPWQWAKHVAIKWLARAAVMPSLKINTDPQRNRGLKGEVQRKNTTRQTAKAE